MNSTEPFETIVSRHHEGLYRFALSLTRSESSAGDLTQQTFYIWATKGHQLRDISKVRSWLYTTLHRTFLQSRRTELKFPHQELNEDSQEFPLFSPEIPNRFDSAQVLLALAKVDEVYQAAVTLFYLEDYSYKEIAEILETPVGTVKSRIARGIGQLRVILVEGDSVSLRRREEWVFSATRLKELIGLA